MPLHFADTSWEICLRKKRLCVVQNVFIAGYSNLSDTEAPKIPTFQGSKNSDTVLG